MFRTRIQKLLLLAAGGVLLAVAAGLIFPPRAILIKRWQRELKSTPSEQVRVRLEQIAAVGDRGVPVLVEALHSDRRDIAETAFELLQRYLDEQELVSAADSSPNVAAMASALGQQSKRRGAFAASPSIKLATRLLLWPTVRRGIDNEQLVADCETVIRAFAVETNTTNELPRPTVVATEYRQLSAPAIASADMLDLPGGGVMPELAEIPDLPRAQRDLPDSTLPDSDLLGSDLLGSDLLGSDLLDSARADGSLVEPQPFYPRAVRDVLEMPAEIRPDPPSERSFRDASELPEQRPGIVLRRDSATPPARQPTASRQPLAARSDLEVMQQLATGTPHAAQRAVEELGRRGFRPRDLRLAERLVHPDPAIRLELASSLPQLAGIDSRPWLIWLSSDPDARVRRSAISIIATGDDPALFDHLRQVEQLETDEEVLRLIRRVLR